MKTIVRKKIPMEKEIYKQLTDEIMYNNSKQDKYTNYAYIILAGIWTATFTTKIAWIVLIPLPILLPICLRIADCRYSIALISSYIKLYLDPIFSINWQTKRMSFNEHFHNTRFIYHGSKFDIPVISSLCSLIFWLMRIIQNNSISSAFVIRGEIWTTAIVVLIQFSIIISEVVVCMKYSDVNKLKKQLFDDWEITEYLTRKNSK